MKSLPRLFLFSLLIPCIAGLQAEATPGTSTPQPPVVEATPAPQFDLPKVTLTLGTNSLYVQIAADDPSRERGLMSQTNISDTEGMIFIFPRPRSVNFWMKDTPTALSIAYIDASGRIIETHDMKPFDETDIPSASSSIVYALEVAQGWFVRHGVLPGDSISGLPAPTIAK